MKVCPVCNKTYHDESLNFCLNDGTTLTTADYDPPPTVVMDNPRKTNPNFSEYESNFGNPNQQIYQQPFGAPTVINKQDQTLPIISLILGVSAIVLTCCFGGLPLGAAAMITGYIAMNNINKDPMQYGGKGLAMGGLILGGIGVLIALGWIFFSFILNF